MIRAGDGLVLIDTSSQAARDRTFAAVRAIDPAPVRAAIYTHGHADHAFGLPPFLAEATREGLAAAADRGAPGRRRALRSLSRHRGL